MQMDTVDALLSDPACFGAVIAVHSLHGLLSLDVKMSGKTRATRRHFHRLSLH
jgi:hypothetical protein